MGEKKKGCRQRLRKKMGDTVHTELERSGSKKGPIATVNLSLFLSCPAAGEGIIIEWGGERKGGTLLSTNQKKKKKGGGSTLRRGERRRLFGKSERNTGKALRRHRKRKKRKRQTIS